MSAARAAGFSIWRRARAPTVTVSSQTSSSWRRRAPLARMFQVDYPYPHLFYFTRRSVVALAERNGFVTMVVRRLRSFSARGALHRARMDRGRGALSAIQAYANAGALVLFALMEP